MRYEVRWTTESAGDETVLGTFTLDTALKLVRLLAQTPEFKEARIVDLNAPLKSAYPDTDWYGHKTEKGIPTYGN